MLDGLSIRSGLAKVRRGKEAGNCKNGGDAAHCKQRAVHWCAMSDDEGSASEGSASDGENPLSFYQGLMRCASTGGGVGEARASRDGKLRRLFVRQDGRVTRQNEAAPLPPAGVCMCGRGGALQRYR